MTFILVNVWEFSTIDHNFSSFKETDQVNRQIQVIGSRMPVRRSLACHPTFTTALPLNFWWILSQQLAEFVRFAMYGGGKGNKRKEFSSNLASSGGGSSNFDEESALKGLREFDPQAISLIHAHYYPDVYRYARYRLDDTHLAEDIAAEVFMRLLEAVNAGQGPRTTLRGWLMATASNMVNDYYRKVYRRPEEELSDQLHAEIPGILSIMENREQLKAVRAALEKLTPDQQNILSLRFGAGYSLEQTAETIGKKVNAVKQLQFRALAALRRHLGEDA